MIKKFNDFSYEEYKREFCYNFQSFKKMFFFYKFVVCDGEGLEVIFLFNNLFLVYFICFIFLLDYKRIYVIFI